LQQLFFFFTKLVDNLQPLRLDICDPNTFKIFVSLVNWLNSDIAFDTSKLCHWLTNWKKLDVDARYVTLEFYFPHCCDCPPSLKEEKTGKNKNCAESGL